MNTVKIELTGGKLYAEKRKMQTDCLPVSYPLMNPKDEVSTSVDNKITINNGLRIVRLWM